MMIDKSVETPGDDLSISTVPQAMVLYNPVLSFEHDKLRSRLADRQHLAQGISPTAHLSKTTPPALILFGLARIMLFLQPEKMSLTEALDLDVDGDLDLVIAGRASNNLIWYENPRK